MNKVTTKIDKMRAVTESMDKQNTVIVPKKKVVTPQPPPQAGPEVWDGNNAGWTLVTYKRKKKTKN